MTDDAKPPLPSAYLGAQVKRWRGERNLSGEQLARRIAEDTGAKLDRYAISKIEAGTRKVTVDEWLHLAYSLGVPPLLLLLPLGEDDTAAIGPDVELPPLLAWRWISGEQPPTSSDRYAVRPAEWNTAHGPVAVYLRMAQVGDQAYRALVELRQCEYIGEEKKIVAARAAYVEGLKRYAAELTRAAASGLRLPPVAQSMLEDMSRLAIDHPALSGRPDGIEIS